MDFVFSAKLLNRYEVKYYFCPECGLLKTEEPFWLDEAYENSMSDLDVGILVRNINNAALLETLLTLMRLDGGKMLDIAGGYGILARLLRDRGFDCFTNDKYSPNIFARLFEPDADFHADTLFAFEVAEHLPDPLNWIRDAFCRYNCRTIILSTTTFSGAIPPADWWYYTFESGQHITFYQPKTLAALAEKLDCHYFMLDSEYHIITDKKISGFAKFLLKRKWFFRLYAAYVRHKRRHLSKNGDDYIRAQEFLQQKHSTAAGDD